MSWPRKCRIWEWNVKWGQVEGLGTGWEVPQLRGRGGRACANSFITGVGFWDSGHLICERFHICKASLTLSQAELAHPIGCCPSPQDNVAMDPCSLAAGITFCRRFLSSADQSHLSGMWPGVAGEGAGQEREPGTLYCASV